MNRLVIVGVLGAVGVVAFLAGRGGGGENVKATPPAAMPAAFQPEGGKPRIEALADVGAPPALKREPRKDEDSGATTGTTTGTTTTTGTSTGTTTTGTSTGTTTTGGGGGGGNGGGGVPDIGSGDE